MNIDTEKTPFMRDCIELMKLPASEGGSAMTEDQAMKVAVEMQKKQNARK